MDKDAKKQKTILLAAGGTGGHMFPAQALALDLIARGHLVTLATDERGRKYQPFAGGVEVRVLSCATVKPGLARKIQSALALCAGYGQSHVLLQALRPDAVVGFGGYPSLMPLLAAQHRGIPTLIHESNAVLGKANVVLAPGANTIAVTVPDTLGVKQKYKNKVVVTGNPVRPEIAALSTLPYPQCEAGGILHIFVMGGSQGAGVFSKVLPAAIALLEERQRTRLRIVQQCREEDKDEAQKIYKDAGVDVTLEPFFKDVAGQLSRAHVFIGRSGATTVAEMTAAGRPAIFVPYPHHADQQQKRNADAVAALGGAWVMTEQDFTPQAVAQRIQGFLDNPAALSEAARHARKAGQPAAARALGDCVQRIIDNP